MFQISSDLMSALLVLFTMHESSLRTHYSFVGSIKIRALETEHLLHPLPKLSKRIFLCTYVKIYILCLKLMDAYFHAEHPRKLRSKVLIAKQALVGWCMCNLCYALRCSYTAITCYFTFFWLIWKFISFWCSRIIVYATLLFGVMV